MRRSALREDLKELAWAVLLVDLVVGLTAVLMASYLGPQTALLIGGGFAALITLTIGTIAAGNLLVIALVRAVRRRQSKAVTMDPG
ncbi:MAG TPA: hypothetical protein VF665_23045 [Longimicrobium sp.]|jgi:uncharacterized membrane protein|uniref:hypothetical protein n=1 Tax=Longimicrobium sp. TaxID=2029185 RepID=UPI002EDA77D9